MKFTVSLPRDAELTRERMFNKHCLANETKKFIRNYSLRMRSHEDALN